MMFNISSSLSVSVHPGWIKTLTRYYQDQTSKILDQMVEKMAAKQKQPSPKQMHDIQQHYGAYQEARVALDQAQEGAMGDYGVNDVFLLLNDNCWYKHPVNEKQLKGGTSNRWMGPAACANPTRTRPCIIRPHPSMHP